MKIDRLHQLMQGTPLQAWADILDTQIENNLTPDAFGKLDEWQQAVDQLPEIKAASVNLQSDAVTIHSSVELTEDEKLQLTTQLKKLMPWRKGPYHIHGVSIDTEWHSDYKWKRIKPFIQPLQGKTILDVGCGNGYHSWRISGEGAELVIGIDPSALFIMQFQAVKHFIGDRDVFVLPLGIEDVPENLRAFDTVFSMGVLYHRKSPIDHLYQLRGCLKSGGELVLETLVIQGDEQQVLVPEDRYAQMRNVWFIPSSRAMLRWLARAGFKNSRLVDESYTSLEEQRSTEWMTFHSLENFLDPDDHTKTVEGYSAPLRATFIAEAP